MMKKGHAEADGAGWTWGFVGRLEAPADRSGRRQWSAEAKVRIVRPRFALCKRDAEKRRVFRILRWAP